MRIPSLASPLQRIALKSCGRCTCARCTWTGGLRSLYLSGYPKSITFYIINLIRSPILRAATSVFACGVRCPLGTIYMRNFVRTNAELCNASRARNVWPGILALICGRNQLFLTVDFETVLVPHEISQIATRHFHPRLKFHEVARQTFRTNSLFSYQTSVDVGAHIILRYFTFRFRFSNL